MLLIIQSLKNKNNSEKKKTVIFASAATARH